MKRARLASLLLPLLVACAGPGGLRCGPGESSEVHELIYFGTDRPGGQVSAEDWTRFLAEEVTPRFPKGLSVWPATGQWQSEGRIVREASYVLNLVHPQGAGDKQAVAALVEGYKKRFQQEAVLRVRAPACKSLL